MFRKKFAAVAAFATMALVLSGCDFSASGTLNCHTEADGKVVCTAEGSGYPEETPAPDPTPTPDPEPTPDPDPTPEPEDPNDGLPAATVFANQSGPNKARVFWATERTDISGWYIERDGTDTSGTGAWGTELSPEITDVTFDLLQPGQTYTFTLIGLTVTGENLEPVTATVTMDGAPEPDPEPEPDPGTDPEPNPGDPDAQTAAEAHGWGTPVVDEQFNYTGAPDSRIWHQAGECWPGHDNNGQRCASNSTVNGTALVQHGEANGDSGWLAQKFGQQYGRWEARVKTEALGPNNDRQYHPLLIVWPDSDQWPAHGEYDFFENGAPELNNVQAFMHYPGHTPKRQEHARKDGVDTSEWHNVAFEWTPDHVKGFIDGEEWFSFGEHDMTAMPSGHLTIQLDNFYGGNMQPANYYVDWVKTYSLS